MISLPVRRLLEATSYQLKLRLLTGERGLSRKIFIPQIQKPGLALTGDTSHLHPGRVQVLGNAEIRYLSRQTPSAQRSIVQKLGKADIACIVLTHGNTPPKDLSTEAPRRRIPLLQTSLSTSTFILRVSKLLEDELTETAILHGVLVDVFGIGVLLTGASGIGKSECGLELVMKGHRLVADDVVHIRKRNPGSLYGSANPLIKYHMEIRGLGIINIKDLFGVASVRDQKLIELVIQMKEWNPRENYERLGIDERTHEILGIPIPYLEIPVRPGRSLTSVIEVAARNQLLKLKGIFSARELQEKLTQKLLVKDKKFHLRDLVLQ